jgi:DNA polymerase-3 subunit delta
MIRTFTGKNSFALQAELKELIKNAQKLGGDFAIEKIDASESDVDTILQAVQSLPFLSPSKLVIISSFQSNPILLERIVELVERTADGVDVVLVEPGLDKRKSYYKQLQKLTELKEFTDPKPQDLPNWLVKYAKEQGSSLSTSDAMYLVDRVGSSQQLLAREVEKLALSGEKISRESIDKLTDRSIQSTIFSLLDASFAGDRNKAIKIYREQRQARVEPQYIISMLTWQLMALAQAVFAQPQTESVLVAAGQSPFTARKSLNLAKNTTKAQIKKMINDLSELDLQTKTSADADAGIELFLIEITS